MGICSDFEFRDAMSQDWKDRHHRAESPRLIIWHTQGFNSGGRPVRPPSPDGSTWHGWIALNGRGIQWIDTDYECGHAWDANPFSIGIETEDTGSPIIPWSDAQLVTMREFAQWARLAHGIPYSLCTPWNGYGQGYHREYAVWNKRNHECPGDARVRQFPGFLDSLAQTLSPSTPTTQEDEMAGNAWSDDKQFYYVVGRGLDDNVWIKRWDVLNARWSPDWAPIPPTQPTPGVAGGPHAFNGSPSIAAGANGRMDVECRGADNAMWRNVLTMSNDVWQGWFSDGGGFH